MTSISSQSVEYCVESEIQKTLKLIQDDVMKIKRELLAIKSIVKDDGPLSMAIKNSNDTLISTAKGNGIDVENLANQELTDTAFLNRISTMEVTRQIQQLLKE